jgi:hypothetical protein
MLLGKSVKKSVRAELGALELIKHGPSICGMGRGK